MQAEPLEVWDLMLWSTALQCNISSGSCAVSLAVQLKHLQMLQKYVIIVYVGNFVSDISAWNASFAHF